MHNPHVFRLIRQPHFQPKRVAMKVDWLMRYPSDLNRVERAEAWIDDAEEEIEETLLREGVPASERRAALAAFRSDLAAIIWKNGGKLPKRHAGAWDMDREERKAR